MAHTVEQVRKELHIVVDRLAAVKVDLQNAKEEIISAKTSGDKSIITESQTRLDKVYNIRVELKNDLTALGHLINTDPAFAELKDAFILATKGQKG